MCNWSQGVMEEGVQQGIKQGIQRGIQQGLDQGRQEGKYGLMLKVFTKLLASGFSFDNAAETAGAETKEDIDFLRKHVLA